MKFTEKEFDILVKILEEEGETTSDAQSIVMAMEMTGRDETNDQYFAALEQ